MKKQLLIASVVFIAGTGVFAQTSSHNFTPVAVSEVNRPVATHDHGRTMTCTADTLRYALVKEYALNPTPAFNALPINPSEEQSQAFVSSGTVGIVGIDFRARVNSANPSATVPVKVYLYSVNAAFQPLARLDSASLSVITTTPKYYHANFSTIHSMTGNYAVAIAASGTFKFDIISNDRDVSTGGEGLSYNRWNPGTGLTWFANADATNGWGQDFDADINPIVTYTIATDFTVSAASPVCIGQALTFTNTTTPANTLSDRMYNYQVFNAYFGASTSDSTFVWDMGDASPLIWSANASYSYPAAGTDTVVLVTLAGFWNSCVDTKSTIITVTPNAVASYTQNTSASPLIAFTSTSTGAATYSWDFGDGSPVDNTANPSHTYAPGTWTVTLTVTSAGGCNTDVTTQTVTVVATGIANYSAGVLNVYPNPSTTGSFTLDMGTTTKAHIEVYNMVGELVYSKEFTAATASIDLSDISAGIYSLKVNANDKNIVKQIVISK